MTTERLDPFVASVFHPTDFSESSKLAFAHALAIALLRQTRLDILHAGEASDLAWHGFPGVRKTLERWGLLEPGSERSAVFDELSVRVQKIQLTGDPTKVSLDYIAEKQPDLVVLATEGRDGPARWVRPSRAEAVVRHANTMTLAVPKGARGFVRPEDGYLGLRRILVPIARVPDPAAALVRAGRAAERLGDGPVEIEVLHVGDTPPGDVTLPAVEGCSWKQTLAQGDVVDEILRAASDADLIVMAADGPDRVLDVFQGTTAERVLRGAECPVLVVPA